MLSEETVITDDKVLLGGDKETMDSPSGPSRDRNRDRTASPVVSPQPIGAIPRPL